MEAGGSLASQSSERPCLKKKGGDQSKKMPTVDLCLPYAHEWMSVSLYMDAHTCVHSCAHTQYMCGKDVGKAQGTVDFLELATLARSQVGSRTQRQLLQFERREQMGPLQKSPGPQCRSLPLGEVRRRQGNPTKQRGQGFCHDLNTFPRSP